MTNRREFLQTGVSVSALPLALNTRLSYGVAPERLGEERVVLNKAVFDDRYAEGRAFAEAIGGFGVPAVALDDGDITGLWNDELDRLWRKKPAAIAGSTQYGPMFALERLAEGRGMRVLLRVAHEPRPDGALAHVVTGPAESIDIAGQLAQQGLAWPVLMAALVSHCRTDGAPSRERTILTQAAKPALTPAPGSTASVPESVIHYYAPLAVQEGHGVPWDGPLFSWLIAPRG